MQSSKSYQHSILGSFKTSFLAVFAITILTVVASYKAFNFYFWHDDFSILYSVKNQICLFRWPHNAYCPIFNFLYDFFGYEPKYFFGLGITLAIFAGITLYLFTKELYDSKRAFLLALLLSSGYFGFQNFLLAYSSITTYLSLLLFFLSLFFLAKFTKERNHPLNLFLGVFFFFITLAIFPLRSSFYIFPATALLILFTKSKEKISKIILPVFILLLIFAWSYFMVPWRTSGNSFSLWTNTGKPALNLELFKNLAKNYVMTTSSFVLTDYMETMLANIMAQKNRDSLRLGIGIGIHLAILVYLAKIRKDRYQLRLALFSLIWIISQYIPLGFAAGWRIESTDRYITFPYIGVVLFLGVIGKTNTGKWLALIILIIFINLFQANKFLSGYEKANLKRAYFYKEIHRQVPSISSGTVLYFDAPSPELKRDLGGFMSAATYDYEATLATELGGVTMEEIKVLHNSDAFLNFSPEKIDINKFHTFFYTGEKLINTTYDTRRILESQPLKNRLFIGRNIKTEFILDPEKKLSTGKNEIINFNFPDFNSILPSKIVFEITAFIPDFPVPYTQNCYDCTYNSNLLKEALVNDKVYEEIKKTPAAMIKTNEDKINLTRLLSTKANVCLEWKSGGFEGRIPFNIMANGKINTYQINLPTLGPEKVNFSLGCLTYPVNLYVFSVTALQPGYPSLQP